MVGGNVHRGAMAVNVRGAIDRVAKEVARSGARLATDTRLRAADIVVRLSV